jgi:hypothetical protein
MSMPGHTPAGPPGAPLGQPGVPGLVASAGAGGSSFTGGSGGAGGGGGAAAVLLAAGMLASPSVSGQLRSAYQRRLTWTYPRPDVRPG